MGDRRGWALNKVLQDALVKLAAQTALSIIGAKVGDRYGERAEQVVGLTVEAVATAITDRAPRDATDEQLLQVVRALHVVPIEELIARGRAGEQPPPR